VKFCSDRCKRNKPSTAAGSLELRVEAALLALLEGRKPPKSIAEGGDAGEGGGGDDGVDRGVGKEGKIAKEGKVAKVVPHQKGKKGDPRIIVALSELEVAVFGDRTDPTKTYGRRKNRAFRGIKDGDEWQSVDMMDPKTGSAGDQVTTKPTQKTSPDKPDDENEHDEYDSTAPSNFDSELDSDSDSHNETNPKTSQGGVALTTSSIPPPPSTNPAPKPSEQQPPDMINLRIRPPQTASEVNFSVGGERGWSEKIAETPEMLQKRREGQKRAEEKEFVKQVARRAVVFGLLVDAPPSASEGERGGGKGSGKGGKGRNAKRKEGEVEESGKGEEKVRRKCEALMQGSVVEPSFAKGDWSVRWRED
jgi:hypothetical protein